MITVNGISSSEVEGKSINLNIVKDILSNNYNVINNISIIGERHNENRTR